MFHIVSKVSFWHQPMPDDDVLVCAASTEDSKAFVFCHIMMFCLTKNSNLNGQAASAS